MSEIPNPVEQQNLAWEDGYRQGLAAAEARAEVAERALTNVAEALASVDDQDGLEVVWEALPEPICAALDTAADADTPTPTRWERA